MTTYEQIDAVNWSTLKHLRISPLHYQSELERGFKETSAMLIGRAIHTLVLEPEKWEKEYKVWPHDSRTAKGWKAFKAEHGHLDILTQPDFERARKAAAALASHDIASHYLDQFARVEEAIAWKDAKTGIPCKGRIDHCSARYLTDLKTTETVIVPGKFAAHAAKLGYHCQLAFYLDGLAANGCDVEPVIVVVQSVEPYDVVVFTLPEDTIEAGRREYRKLLELLAKCRKADHWPGIAEDGPVDLYLPAWATPRDEITLTMGGVAMEF